MGSKGENKFMKLEAKINRGYSADLEESRFLLRLVGAQQQAQRQLHAELEETQKDLGAIRTDPLPQLARHGWQRKFKLGRLCFLWQQKSGCAAPTGSNTP